MYDFRMATVEREDDPIIRWVAEGLAKPGKTQGGLAAAMGVGQPRISEILAGTRRIQASELPKMSEYLDEPAPELTPMRWKSIRVKVSGRVQAGHWAAPGDEEEWAREYISVPLPENLEKVRKFALRVVGPSMNRVYPEGSILVCAHIEDLHDDTLLPGKRYIVRKTDNDGRIETTVKELEADGDGRYWLWPRSDHPQHQTPLEWNEETAKEVELHARVLWSLKPD